MPRKFKDGDTVVVTRPRDGSSPGDIGIVMRHNPDPGGGVYILVMETGRNCGREGAFLTNELELYTRVDNKNSVKFESVIMPDSHHQAIMDALNQVNDYELIFTKWGFDEIMEKGRAISMLFYGPPGTGKTLCAQAIADHLKRQLKVIGTADVESMNPGQAERNLKAYFENTKNDTVLLFDECDSLVFDRNKVGSILGAQVNALLTALERFEGVVIFTTNRLGTLDEAFNRRLSLKLEFPMPTVEQRVKIWQRMFPKKCPLAKDINWEKLAEIEITGGYIKNIVLRSARTAAARKLKLITYEVIIEATKAEIKSKQEFEHARETHTSIPGLYADHADYGMDKGVGLTKQMIKDKLMNSGEDY